MEARYLTDENGKRLFVILDIEEYERLMELEDIRRFDEAMAWRERGEDEMIPWEGVRDKIGSEYKEPAELVAEV